VGATLVAPRQHRLITANTEPAGVPTVANWLDDYAVGAVIGRGGMGEVVSAHHRLIGRDVAIKRLKAEDPTEEEIARFMREARIQARLDHPAIVPVHEVGHDEGGRPFFTMKRLTGITLAELLVGAPPLPHRLLRAFAEISLAVDFAHSRGIIHRDLKPSNIMLGDFGEVYVIDWGLARVAGDVTGERGLDALDTIDDLGGATGEGAMLGTPGYMSPEQIHDAATVDRPTDVYALGAILFEILAGEPLHPRGMGAVASTLNELDVSPARRRPDRNIPPELDTLCVEALARKPAARPTVRVVAEAVQRYLDGDRDVTRRRAMSADQLALARLAVGEDRRAEAVRAASRALSLDPESTGAAELVTALMLQPPREPPPELEAEYRADDAGNTRRHARVAGGAYFVLLALIPVMAWSGIRSWGLILAIGANAILLSATAWAVARRPEAASLGMWGYAVGNAVLIGLTARMCGPFILVPAFACMVTMSILMYPMFIGRGWAMVGMMMTGWIVPIGLELLGTLSSTWHVVDGVLVLSSHTLEFTARTIPLILIISVMIMLVAGLLVGTLYEAQHQAQRQLLAQAWHLRQLLPSDASDSARFVATRD